MTVSITQALLITILMASLNVVSGQLVTTVVGVQDIISLLENITDTSTTTSMFLPHLASLLKNQEDVQLFTNLLLQNSTDTCSVDEVASILQNLMEDQNGYFDQSIRSQIRMEDLLDQMVTTQTQMANALTQNVNIQNRTEAAINQMANALIQSVNIQNHTEASLDQMTNTQTQMANALTQNVNIHNCTEATLDQTANTQLAHAFTESLDTQNRTEVTINQMANTQTQMANTLTQSVDTQNRMEATLDQMANTLTQVANIMQMQSEQLQIVTSTMTYMVRQLDTQNQLISHLPTDIPKDCSDLASQAPHPSGPYTIRPWDELGNMHVYCDMDTDGNGWTVFQRRFDGSVDFYRGWDDYENGFGSPYGEHWLGLRQIYRLTRQGSWTLRIDLEDFQGNTAYAVYQSFSVGDAQSYYRLSIGAYSGTAGDSMTEYGHNQAFTTKDSDNDGDSTQNCAVDRQGAWWYKNCNYSNLNGLYLGPSQDTDTGMTWHHWKNNREVLKKSVMKIQRIN